MPRSYAFILVALFFGCDSPPKGEVREWKASDHDKGDPNATGQVKTQGPGSAAGSKPKSDEMLVEVVWQNQCLACHGNLGKGDGPNGPLLHATDLTREDWQSKITDAQIAASIKNGKGLMPKFEMTESLMTALVRRIRALRGMR